MIEAALSSCSMERFAMSYSGSASVVTLVFDAPLSPESWPLALEAVAETVGAIGAACIVRSKETAGSSGSACPCPGDIAAVFGDQIKTLRTQLRPILRKAGVKRQLDLLRVLRQ
jgi:hypothetical protein